MVILQEVKGRHNPPPRPCDINLFYGNVYLSGTIFKISHIILLKSIIATSQPYGLAI